MLTTGYNGAPRNFPHPIDVGCLRDELRIPHGMLADICPCLHAEQNAIIQAATTGVSIDGADLFCTTQPCTQCSRMVANCGIKRVVFEEDYPDPLATGILTTAGVELWRWDAEAKRAMRIVRPNTFQEAQDGLRKKWASGEMAAAPPPGAGLRLPMAGQIRAPDTPWSTPAEGAPPSAPRPWAGTTADAGADADRDGVPDRSEEGRVRDLRDDPHRAEIIKRLAREKAEKKRKAMEDAGR